MTCNTAFFAYVIINLCHFDTWYVSEATPLSLDYEFVKQENPHNSNEGTTGTSALVIKNEARLLVLKDAASSNLQGVKSSTTESVYSTRGKNYTQENQEQIKTSTLNGGTTNESLGVTWQYQNNEVRREMDTSVNITPAAPTHGIVQKSSNVEDMSSRVPEKTMTAETTTPQPRKHHWYRGGSGGHHIIHAARRCGSDETYVHGKCRLKD
ncbi:uncharacterized protein LOC106646656 [Copidosoma floridanum]|uniref:uncharacterized protein LOC106646656 n=1 Tax=Copidosoma floridanum TaxID=29053 RepID=UPI0006C9A57C|nr:uncharacterized protein LOC106646656 [Copidosoma floridanum]